MTNINTSTTTNNNQRKTWVVKRWRERFSKLNQTLQARMKERWTLLNREAMKAKKTNLLTRWAWTTTRQPRKKLKSSLSSD
jgi:hypothetical protein